MPSPPERRSHVLSAVTKINRWIWAVMAVATLNVLAILVVAVFAREALVPASQLITSVLAPILIGFLGKAMHGVAVVADGQVGQIIHTLQDKAEAQVDAAYHKGTVDGLTQGPQLVKEATQAVKEIKE